MANISLYVSGQTELNDVTEFFQKRLIGEGENPIAFFDGVFYESQQERVGNIVFQDYLVYTDKAVYLWARGTSKDFLDRFSLGTVSVNSRNKDSAFATLNLRVRREGKDPVFVIFDMVEIREAETITRLHTAIESVVENYLGPNFRHEIPDEVANNILQSAWNICPPRSIFIPMESVDMPTPDAGIGYGQDLLEQYKASIGYTHQQNPQNPGAGPRQQAGGGSAPEMPRGLEGILPTDPAAIKRIAGQLKGMVGDAPLKLRDQLMKDLQHVPNDVSTILTALNELLSNIAGNPQAERFVMNVIKTAVENDGILGSVGKIIKLTGIGSPKKAPSRSGASSAPEDRSSRQQRSPVSQDDSDMDTTVRRRKISVRDDDEHPDIFADEASSHTGQAATETAPLSGSRRQPIEDDDDADLAPRRKKLSIKTEGDVENDIARKLMSYDESEREQESSATVSASVTDLASADLAPRRKKLSINADDDVEDDIDHKLMNYDESPGEQAVSPVVSWPVADPADADPAPRRKKLQIRVDNSDDNGITSKLMSYDESLRVDRPVEIPREPFANCEPAVSGQENIRLESPSENDELFTLSEEEVQSAVLGSMSDENYLTIESDLPLSASAAPSAKNVASGSGSVSGINPRELRQDDDADKTPEKHSVSVKPTP